MPRRLGPPGTRSRTMGQENGKKVDKSQDSWATPFLRPRAIFSVYGVSIPHDPQDVATLCFRSIFVDENRPKGVLMSGNQGSKNPKRLMSANWAKPDPSRQFRDVFWFGDLTKAKGANSVVRPESL